MFHKLRRFWLRKNKSQKEPLKIRSKYDIFLLDSLHYARIQWLKAIEDCNTGIGSDDDLLIRVELAQQRYWYLYRIARLRHIHGRFDINQFK